MTARSWPPPRTCGAPAPPPRASDVPRPEKLLTRVSAPGVEPPARGARARPRAAAAPGRGRAPGRRAGPSGNRSGQAPRRRPPRRASGKAARRPSASTAGPGAAPWTPARAAGRPGPAPAGARPSRAGPRLGGAFSDGHLGAQGRSGRGRAAGRRGPRRRLRASPSGVMRTKRLELAHRRRASPPGRRRAGRSPQCFSTARSMRNSESGTAEASSASTPARPWARANSSGSTLPPSAGSSRHLAGERRREAARRPPWTARPGRPRRRRRGS